MSEALPDFAFPAPSREEWATLVERVLKGRDPETLVSRSHDGLRIEPLYPKAERAEAVGRGGAEPWQIAARVDAPDPAEANRLLIPELENGANALVLTFAGGVGARGFGISPTPAALVEALEDVLLEGVSVRLDAGEDGLDVARSFLALVHERAPWPGNRDLDLAIDPIGALATTGRLPGSWRETARDAAALAAETDAVGLRTRVFLADGRPYGDAGASEAQELAAVLATALAYLRVLEEAGLALEDARDALSFLLVADTDVLLTVAKFRALRRLWARIEEACGLEPKPLRVHAETAWRTLTRRDPYVNILRGTMAAFSAGIGGADVVSVLPFTAALGLPDAFARRLARNTQLVLLEEANLWRVADPVAGSGAFEALTETLATEAWDLFTGVEREGGIAESLARGTLPEAIAAVRKARENAVATRREPLVGTSTFPHLAETPVSVLLPAQPSVAPETERALRPRRLAEPFEALRDRADALAAERGRRPLATVIAWGEPAAAGERVSFVRNLLAAGGVETELLAGDDGALPEPERISGGLVCLCSTDAGYGERAVAIARALESARPARLYLAGRPGEHEAELRAAGVTGFVYSGCDALAVLGDALDAVALSESA